MRYFFVFMFIFTATSCKKGIELIGVDVDGIERHIKVDDKKLSQHISSNLYETYQWVQDNSIDDSHSEKIPWEPEAVVVGLGVEGSISLFGNWQFRAAPGIMVAILKLPLNDRPPAEEE